MKNTTENMDRTAAIPDLAETRAVGRVAGQHTAGPWHVVGGDMVNTTAGTMCIACEYSGDGRAEDAANARLIAAAPEMLAACGHALDWLASYPGGGADSAYRYVRAAIAKAEGRA